VVDTSFLVSDVLGATRAQARTAFLEMVGFGTLRPFAAHHVWAEMGRKVQDVPARHGLDPELAERIWWEEYVPRIRFVDVRGLPVPSADAILGRDASDAPTFALAGLLAPVVVLAGDRDITDLGLAQHYSLVICHAGTLTVVGQGTWSASLLALLGFHALGWTIRTATATLRQPAGQAVVMLGTMGLLVTGSYWLPGLRQRLFDHRGGARTILGDITTALSDVARMYKDAANAYEGAAYGSAGTSLTHRSARALAVSPHPITRSELAALLLPDAPGPRRSMLVSDLGVVLPLINAFSRVGPSRWELGRAGVDFGRRAPQTSVLRRGNLLSFPER
jgi:hypothetical protein